MNIGFDHLVVTTTTQCLVYSTKNWHNPVAFDLKNGAVTMIKQAPKHMLIADKVNGIQVPVCS